jgi:hypothetical protein
MKHVANCLLLLTQTELGKASLELLTLATNGGLAAEVTEAADVAHALRTRLLELMSTATAAAASSSALAVAGSKAGGAGAGAGAAGDSKSAGEAESYAMAEGEVEQEVVGL